MQLLPTYKKDDSSFSQRVVAPISNFAFHQISLVFVLHILELVRGCPYLGVMQQRIAQYLDTLSVLAISYLFSVQHQRNL